MEYIYAAMLLHKAGKKIDDVGVKKVLEAAGVTPDEVRVKALVAALDGVEIEKAIKEAAVTAVPVNAAPAENVTSPEGAEQKKEEKSEKPAGEEKKEEEQAAAGLGALFG